VKFPCSQGNENAETGSDGDFHPPITGACRSAVPDYDVTGWFELGAPKGTPQPIISKSFT
jgi:hypothetical protein